MIDYDSAQNCRLCRQRIRHIDGGWCDRGGSTVCPIRPTGWRRFFFGYRHAPKVTPGSDR